MNTKQRTISTLVLLLSMGCISTQFLEPTATLTPTITFTSTPFPSTPTRTFTPSPTNTPDPTATLSIAIPKPNEGKGIVVGQVFHGGKPASDLGVQLCSIFFAFGTYDFGGSPCDGNKYRVAVNSDGYYIFKNVQPGGYQGLIFILPTNSVLAFYDRGGLDILNVEAGQVVFFETKDLDY